MIFSFIMHTQRPLRDNRFFAAERRHDILKFIDNTETKKQKERKRWNTYYSKYSQKLKLAYDSSPTGFRAIVRNTKNTRLTTNTRRNVL